MKLGDIKAEALRLMFINLGQDIDGEYLSQLKSDAVYRLYLSNMAGAINRCFSVLEQRRMLPLRSCRLTEGAIVARLGGYAKYDMKKIGDFFDLDRITAIRDGEYIGNVPIFREGELVILPEDGAEYTAVYYPTVKRVTSVTDDMEELAVPEDIAAVIPYFIKSDLYRSEDPREAAEARNIFEGTIEEMHIRSEGRQERVRTVYSQTEDI